MNTYKKANGDLVNRNDWHWEFTAHYKDGSTLPQFNDATNQALGFFDIDQEKLASFEMRHDIHSYKMDFPEGAKLIHKRRTTELKNNSTRVITYMFGWEKGKDIVLHYLVQHVDDNWIKFSTTDKTSLTWLN